jgi:precorrin-2 methylase
MKTEQFNEIINEQISRSLDVLVVKAKEYATNDRLHNFKVAAVLKDETPVQALAGMMAKHTVSVYDMSMAKEIDRNMDTWNEKITDSINYLLILRALIEEADNE